MSPAEINAAERIELALKMASDFGQTDGDHHKAWVIDQMVRCLTGCPLVELEGIDYRGNTYTYETQGESEEYAAFVTTHCEGEDGPGTYAWEEGIAP